MEEKKQGLFSRIKDGLKRTRDTLTQTVDTLLGAYKELDDEFYEELEMALITADVGVKMTTEVVEALRKVVLQKRLTQPEQVKQALRELMCERMSSEPFDPKRPAIVLVVGVNGVGKTTFVGKLAHKYTEEGKSVMMAAADTFRAAATEQLAIWAERAGVPLIRHAEGADAATVVYDAVQSAKAKKTDVLLVDTAGRLHNKNHLMEELKKVRRVIDREYPEANVFALMVLDATTGQNGLAQAKVFGDAVQLDGIVLTKLDGTAKGGIAMAVKAELSLPVYYIGVGEGIEDLQPFDAETFTQAIL